MSTPYIPIPPLRPQTGPQSLQTGSASYIQFGQTGIQQVDIVLLDAQNQLSSLVDQVQSLVDLTNLPIQIPVFLGGVNHQPGLVPDPYGAPARSYLDAAGAFSIPSMIRGSAYSAAVQTISDSTITALTFDTAIFDNGAPVHSTISNQSRFATGKTGWHMAIGQVAFATSAIGVRQIRIKVNGADLVYIPAINAMPPSANTAIIQVSVPLELVAGDYVEFSVLQSSGGNLNTVANLCWGSLTLLTAGG